MATTANLPAAANVGLTNLAVSQAINTAVTVFTAGTSGSKVVGLMCASADASSRDVLVYLTRSSTNYLIGRVTVAANAGNANGTPIQNLLANSNVAMPIDNDGQPYLLLKSGDTITVQIPVTNAGIMSITAIGSDF